MSDRSTRAELVGAADRSASSQPPDAIAVVIPTALQKGPDGWPLVAGCLESLVPAAESPDERAADGGPRVREILLVTQGRPFEGPVVARLRSAGVDVRQLDVLGPFNFSKKVNAGVAVATADTLFLLNDDAVMCDTNWPSVFLDILSDPTVGAVSPIIRNPDGTLNAAGDTHSADGVRHVDGFDARYRPGLVETLARDHDVSLLTGAALAISASAFRLVGDFDEIYPSALGDTDFCLRLRAAGRRLVCTPRATVVHAEASTRDPKVPQPTFALFRREHPQASLDDPMLPPLELPRRTRIARSIVRPLRDAYRRTIKRFVPRSLHLRLWRVAVSHGWIR